MRRGGQFSVLCALYATACGWLWRAFRAAFSLRSGIGGALAT